MDLGIIWVPAPPELYDEGPSPGSHNEGPPNEWFGHDHWREEALNRQGFQDARGLVEEYTQQYYLSLLCHNQAKNQRA